MHADVLAALTAGRFAADIGCSLREGFYMFRDTLWALVLGFTLSGALQAFVSRDEMRRRLGDHRPASVTGASLYGMASSSCSYAASAMARSLVARGTDFVAAMVFMFASTNLVIELGIVLVVLIGWQFLVAEFVGGITMIALLVALGGLWLRGRALAEARTKVESDQPDHDHRGEAGLQRLPWRQRLRSRAGWADAAGYTISDLTMLRKEMVIGFTVAGLLATLVPVRVWNTVFLHGHGALTTIENALIGPFVAIISFVCSVGNVALAAALWQGGISFDGVVSFIFADLITLPLLLIYRKQYGRRMTLRLLALFWVVMSAAGLVTERCMGHRRDQRGLRGRAWDPAIHQGHLKDLPFGGAEQVRLQADLAGRVVEAVGPEPGQRGGVRPSGPRLLWHASLQQLELARNDLRGMVDGYPTILAGQTGGDLSPAIPVAGSRSGRPGALSSLKGRRSARRLAWWRG